MNPAETYVISYYTTDGKYKTEYIPKNIYNGNAEFMSNDNQDANSSTVMIYIKSDIKPITKDEFDREFNITE